jgi:preprotein translocase SecF subunit
VGAILTVAGYSINDTIVIFDRIREGLREGHGQKNNLPQLFNACLNATLSRTLLTSGTTLTTVAALFFFGGVAINDFALVLLIGIMAGTYSSIFIACPVVLMMGKGEIVRRKKTAIAEASVTP